MKLRSLLALPLALAIAACSTPPEPTATDKEDALDKCDVKLGIALDEIKAERAKFDADPKRYQQLEEDDYGAFISTFQWSFLLPTFYQDVDIIRGYCEVRPSSKFNGLYHASAFVEYLEVPDDDYSDSSVERVYVTGSSFTWRVK